MNPKESGMFEDILNGAKGIFAPAIEKMLMLNPGYGELRKKQITQYFHPELDVLPDTKYRPTALTNANQNAEWKTMKPFLPDSIELRGNINHTNNPFNGLDTLDLKTAKLPLRLGNANRYHGYLNGTGQATGSIGKDDKGYYYSIYDSWDFKPSISSPIMAIPNTIMDAVGTPFNVYDRFYFEPEEKHGRQIVPRKIPVNNKDY